MFACVERAFSIRVAYQTPDEGHVERVLEDFPARVFQHEFDHLHGITMFDRAVATRDIVCAKVFDKAGIREVEEARKIAVEFPFIL